MSKKVRGIRPIINNNRFHFIKNERNIVVVILFYDQVYSNWIMLDILTLYITFRKQKSRLQRRLFQLINHNTNSLHLSICTMITLFNSHRSKHYLLSFYDNKRSCPFIRDWLKGSFCFAGAVKCVLERRDRPCSPVGGG